MKKNLRVLHVFCVGVAILSLAGCADPNAMPVATVNGKVICNGEPVKGGLVYFEPVQQGDSALAGKSGLGVIQEDGTFKVSTYGTEDGAVVGTHQVKVDQGSGPGCDCAMNPGKVVTEVEVTEDGSNDFTIELPEKTAIDERMAAQRAEEEDEDEED